MTVTLMLMIDVPDNCQKMPVKANWSRLKQVQSRDWSKHSDSCLSLFMRLTFDSCQNESNRQYGGIIVALQLGLAARFSTEILSRDLSVFLTAVKK